MHIFFEDLTGVRHMASCSDAVEKVNQGLVSKLGRSAVATVFRLRWAGTDRFLNLSSYFSDRNQNSPLRDFPVRTNL